MAATRSSFLGAALFVPALVLASVPALAQSNDADAKDAKKEPAGSGIALKVGFVNVSRVLEVAPQAVAAQERITKEFAPRDQGLLDLQRSLRQLEDSILNDAGDFSAAERARREAEARSLKRDLRRAQEEFREDLGVRRSEELSKLQRQVAETIRKMAKRDAYDLVLSNGVVYAGARVDLTDAVIKQLESEKF